MLCLGGLRGRFREFGIISVIVVGRVVGFVRIDVNGVLGLGGIRFCGFF